MGAQRLEVVEAFGGWIVSDQRGEPARYPSETQALGEAMKQAERMAAAGTSVEVHLWMDGKDTIIFYSACAVPDP